MGCNARAHPRRSGRPPRTPGCDDGAAGASPADPDSVPDPARARRSRARLRAGDSRLRAASSARARRRAAATALLLGVLHLAARPARERASDRAPGGRARADDDGRGRRRRPRGDRARLGDGVRARGGRRTDRSDRRDCDLAPARGAAPHRHDRRGREPRQRRDGTRRPPRRGRRRSFGHVLPLRRRPSLRRCRRRRPRGRPGGRLHRPPGTQAHRRPAGRGDDLAPHGILRVHPGRPAPRLRRRRRRHGGRLSRLAHAGADDARLPPARRQHVGDHHVRAQCSPLRHARVAAPEHPRCAPGRADLDPDLVGGDREPHRDRGADRVGVPGDLRSSLAVEEAPRA